MEQEAMTDTVPPADAVPQEGERTPSDLMPRSVSFAELATLGQSMEGGDTSHMVDDFDASMEVSGRTSRKVIAAATPPEPERSRRIERARCDLVEAMQSYYYATNTTAADGMRVDRALAELEESVRAAAVAAQAEPLAGIEHTAAVYEQGKADGRAGLAADLAAAREALADDLRRAFSDGFRMSRPVHSWGAEVEAQAWAQSATAKRALASLPPADTTGTQA